MIKEALLARAISKIIPGSRRPAIELAIRSGLYRYVSKPLQIATEKGLSIYPTTAVIPKRARKVMAESPFGTVSGGILGSFGVVPGSGTAGAMAGGIGTTAIKRSVKSKLNIPHIGPKPGIPSLETLSRARRMYTRKSNRALIQEYAGRKDILGAPAGFA